MTSDLQTAVDMIGRASWSADRNREDMRFIRLGILWMAERLDMSKADRRDLERILSGKRPYRRSA